MYVYVTVYVAISVNIYRDALISIYPNIETLMCYFHVVNCCKKNLRSHQAPTQKVIIDEIYNLHSSVSQQEFEGRYREVSARWRNEVPEFARYFHTQWFLGNFNDWQIYCSAPGVASTNNALESFNNIIKRCYTLNARHSLSALVDLFMERLVFDEVVIRLDQSPSAAVAGADQQICTSSTSLTSHQWFPAHSPPQHLNKCW